NSELSRDHPSSRRVSRGAALPPAAEGCETRATGRASSEHRTERAVLAHCGQPRLGDDAVGHPAWCERRGWGSMVSMALPVDTGRWPDHISGEWTVDALETLPDNGLRYEILDGTLLVTPSPTPRHQGAIVELTVLLRNACPSDHKVFVAPLDWQPDGRTSLEPDLMVVRRDRIGEKNITQPPALVVEVLSP